MKNKIIDYHPIKGYITFNDLINDIEIISKDYKLLEEIIINILEYQKIDSEIISDIFNNDIYNRLEDIIYIFIKHIICIVFIGNGFFGITRRIIILTAENNITCTECRNNYAKTQYQNKMISFHLKIIPFLSAAT